MNPDPSSPHPPLLSDSEERLRLALETGRIGLWVWNSTDVSNAGDWSPRLKEIFGLPPGTEVTHDLFLKCLHPEDRDRVNTAVLAAISGANDGRYQLEYRAIHADDSVHWVTARGQAFFNPDGTPFRFIGTVMDITERRLAEESSLRLNHELEQRIQERTAEIERANAALKRDLEERKRIEERLKQSEDELRLAIDTIPGLVWVASADGHVEYHNQRWIDYVGLSPEQASGWGWQAAIHPEDLPGLTAFWKSMLATGQAGGAEARLRRFDGVYRWFLFRGVPLYDADGQVIKWYGQNTDIDERRRAADLVAAAKRLLEMIAQGDALCRILDALCRLAEKLAGDVLVSILLTSADGQRLCHGAAPSLPKTYTDAIDGALIGPQAGSCGTAAWRREPVIVTDIASDPLWQDYRDLALAHDLRSCWSTPILSTTRTVLGSFALYQRRVGGPSPEQHAIVEQFAHLASIAIERNLAQEATRTARARFEGILDIADDAIISVDDSQRIVLFNQGAEKVFGYSAEEVIGQSISRLLPERFTEVHRQHIKAFAEAPEMARTMGQRREVYGRRRDGSEFPAEASISKLDLSHETVLTVILRDISERKKTAEALHLSERLARGQAEALTRTLDALARESSPDRLLEHVLCTLTEQLEAHSASVWLRDPSTGLMMFEFALEEGLLHTKANEQLARTCSSLRIEDIDPWPQVFRTGKPALLEDIRTGPKFPWRERVLAMGVVSILAVPMLIAGDVQGIVGVRFSQPRAFQAGEMELAQALAHQAMLAIQLMRLHRENRESAVLAERNRMARDIHDTLAQGLTGVIVQLEAAEDAQAGGFVEEGADHLTRATDLARESLREARRSVHALRPSALEEADLCAALRSMLAKMSAGTSLHTTFHTEGAPRPLPAEIEENLLRIGQEVFTNVLRHAHASEFTALIAFGDDSIRAEFHDNGRGFDRQGKSDGFGLIGMEERAQSMAGTLTIHSQPAHGTTVTIVLPIPAKSGPDLV